MMGGCVTFHGTLVRPDFVTEAYLTTASLSPLDIHVTSEEVATSDEVKTSPYCLHLGGGMSNLS